MLTKGIETKTFCTSSATRTYVSLQGFFPIVYTIQKVTVSHKARSFLDPIFRALKLTRKEFNNQSHYFIYMHFMENERKCTSSTHRPSQYPQISDRFKVELCFSSSIRLDPLNYRKVYTLSLLPHPDIVAAFFVRTLGHERTLKY